MKSPVYSIVIPVYNSATTISEVCRRIHSLFERENLSYEIICVEDSGKDNSWELICSLKNENDKIKGIKLAKNFGQHNATIAGLNFASGDFVITIDDDLQIQPEDIILLIRRQQEASSDIVYGVYREKKHHFIRNIGSNIVQYIFRYVINSKGSITSFRLMSKHIRDCIISHNQNFIFIDGLIHWHTRYIERVYVDHSARKDSSSNYTIRKLVSLTLNLLFNFTTLPLKFIILAGTLCSLISFLIGIYLFVRRFLYNVPLGYTTVVVSIFFSTGIILLVLGVIAEYIQRIYLINNGKPQYSIKEIK